MERRFQFPQGYIFVYAVPKEFTVVVIQFRRQHGQAFIGSAFIKGIAFIEELGQFCRESRRRAICKSILFIKGDTGFRRIRYDEFQRIFMSQGHERIIFIAGAEHGLDGSNDPVFFIDFAILLAAQADRVNIILFSKAVRLARPGHDDSDAAIKTIFFISYIDGVIDEGPQEIAFSEL